MRERFNTVFSSLSVSFLAIGLLTIALFTMPFAVLSSMQLFHFHWFWAIVIINAIHGIFDAFGLLVTLPLAGYGAYLYFSDHINLITLCM
jgi:hypothetical protein